MKPIVNYEEAEDILEQLHTSNAVLNRDNPHTATNIELLLECVMFLTTRLEIMQRQLDRLTRAATGDDPE